MCGSIYNVYEYPGLSGILLLAKLRHETPREEIEQYVEKTFNVRPGAIIPTLVPHQGQAKAVPSTWWLKLVLKEEQFTPDSQWKTFNCRSTKLLTSPLHKIQPVSRRSVVLAEGFHEWQAIYLGNRTFDQLTSIEQENRPKPVRKQCYLIRPKTGVCRFAALTKKWNQETYSTGIITLPGHEGFKAIHPNSFPLILKPKEISDWLNPKIPTSQFQYLMEINDFREIWTATPVVGPESTEAIGETIELVPAQAGRNL